MNILRVPSNRVAINKGSGRSWLVLKYFNAGLPNTGDNSFFDYPFTVVRYKTEGAAQASRITMNMWTDGLQTWGGSNQFVRSDEYTLTTIKRDSFNGNGVSTNDHTNQYIHVGLFEDDDTIGSLHIDFIAFFKSEEDTEAFMKLFR